MPGIKKAKGFFYSLLIMGTLVIVGSLYSSVWAAPNAVHAPANATQVALVASLNLTPPVDVPAGGAITAFTLGQANDAILASPDGNVTVTIPSHAPKGTSLLMYTPKTSADAPGVQSAGMSLGDTIFELTGVDTSGVSASTTSFDSPITISVQFTDADLEAAEGNPTRLVIHKYDSAFQSWSPLTTTINIAAKTASTQVSSVSLFAVMGAAQPPTPTPTPTATLLPGVATSTPTPSPTATLLPPTPGDVAPGSGLLMGLLITAFILIAAGSYYMRQSRQN